MPETRDQLLPTAGGLLMAAGGIAAFTGGVHGLADTRPGLVVLSVLLLMGYGVVGYLLMTRGRDYFHVALPATAVLVVATLLLFQSEMGSFLDDAIFRLVLQPTLALMLAFAGGALLTHVVEETTSRVRWPGKAGGSLNTLLHVAAYAPIWSAFTLLYMLGAGATPMWTLVLVGGAVAVAITGVVGGYAASRGLHPAFTVAGAGLAFAANVMFLYQFMLGGGSRDIAFFGQFNALIGLILTGLPVAIGAVAWLQARAPAADDEPSLSP